MSAVEVVVAVLTYRRPDDLATVLPLLLAQAASVDVEVEVLVVDNDPDAGARPVVEAEVEAKRGARYVHEPRPGIAAARNRALDEAGGASALVFIDDDERPSEQWLALMLDTWRRTGAAAVVGAVVSAYATEPDPWIVAGRFFDRRRLATGTVVETAATNNLLLDLARLDGLRFDERFGLAGGSDTLFTRALARTGGRLVWNDEAVVVDQVPVARLTRPWVMQKALRSGNSWSRTSLELGPRGVASLPVRLGLTARGVVRALGGSAQASLGTVTRSTSLQARGARTAARGAGMAAGAWGYVYQEYRRRPPAGPTPAPSPRDAGRGRLELVARRAVRRVRKRVKRAGAHVATLRLGLQNRFGRRSVTGDAPVSVSLTTHGERLSTVALTIESIARGRVRPARLVLWLDDPDAFADLPVGVRRLRARGLEVRLTENLGPHTKYYPYVLDVPDHRVPLVTADDDIVYPRGWLGGLLAAHDDHPDAVSCYRASVVAVRGDRVAPYASWPRCTDTVASTTRFATGVAGVLYPPAMLERLREHGDAFRSLTPRADDVWLHWVALRTGTVVRQVARTPRHFPFVPGTQESGLLVDNVGGGANDAWVAAVYDGTDVAALRAAGAPEARPAV